MICETVKAGMECAFMSKKGCGFNGGICSIVIEKCEGCNKVIEYTSAKYCKVYPDPKVKWAIGSCPTASHVKKGKEEVVQKVNPIKASKRSKK